MNKDMLDSYNKMMDEYLAGDNEIPIEDRRYYINSRNRYHHILKYFPDNIAGKKILDIGVSKCTYFIKDYCPEAEVTALCLYDHDEERLKSHGIDIIIHNLEKEGDLPEDEFDIIIFGEVLEHLTVSPRITLAKLRRMLKKGGILITTTPNFLSLGNRMKFIAGKNPLEPIKKDLSDPGHFREYSMDELKVFYEDVGLKIVKAEFPDYWNDPKVHFELYKLDKVSPIKLYLIYLPFILFKLAVSTLFPSMRYGLFIIGEK